MGDILTPAADDDLSAHYSSIFLVLQRASSWPDGGVLGLECDDLTVGPQSQYGPGCPGLPVSRSRGEPCWAEHLRWCRVAKARIRRWRWRGGGRSEAWKVAVARMLLDALAQALQTDGVQTTLLTVDEQEATGVALIFLLPRADKTPLWWFLVANGRVGEDAKQCSAFWQPCPWQALVLQLEIPPDTGGKARSCRSQIGISCGPQSCPAQPCPWKRSAKLHVLLV